jgi:hypothetical protein
MEPGLHPSLGPVLGLLGSWRGEGKGQYPTVQPFSYKEEVRFAHDGRPLLSYEQRTRRDGTPSHGERGYWRLLEGGRVELVLTHTTSITEIAEGTVADGRIDVRSTHVHGTSTAKEVLMLERSYHLEGDVLRYELRMEAVGQPLSGHLMAELRRTG